MAKLHEVRRTQRPIRVIMATAWTPVPLIKKLLDVNKTIELLHRSRIWDPDQFERCGCSALSVLVTQAKAEKMDFIQVRITDERVTKDGVKMLRFSHNEKSYEVGEKCFEDGELSS